MIGTTISHYQIEAELGRGGMGVVYKATDTKLNRTVALKFLPPHVVAAEKDRVRFRREAQAAAGLSHPNIATVFAIEEADDQAFIAMEFVDGETLADRIERGPLKVEDAIDLAIQIAEGLQVAHEQQIVHRDIKPSNIMLTSRGHVKIMDFGLAKVSQASMLTQTGSTLGTVGYMSPEQARGEDVDRRTDIWGLGCVLYQMITGRTPFVGEYEQAIVYSILNSEPEPLTSLRTGVPIALDGIMAKILAKDPSMRYQHVDELPADLKAVKAGASGTMMSRAMPAYSSASMAPAAQSVAAPAGVSREVSAVEVRSVLPTWLPWAVAGAGLLAAFVLFLLRPAPPETEPVRMLALPMPDGEGYLDDAPAISQDGSTIAFEYGPGENQLYSYRLDEGKHIPLATIYEARGEVPFLSPSGRSVGWGGQVGFFQVNREGGNAVKLKDFDGFQRYTWISESDLLVAVSNAAVSNADENHVQFLRIRDARVDSMATLALSDARIQLRYLDLIPDTPIALVSWVQSDSESESGFSNRVGTMDIQTGEFHELASNAMQARWLNNGYVVFARGANLMAMSYDVGSGAAGPAFQVHSGIRTWGDVDTRFDLSDNGVLVFNSGDQEVERNPLLPTVGTSADNFQRFESFELNVRDPRLSPDGTRMLVASLQEDIDVWLLDLERSTFQRMTYTDTEDETPAWSPDNRHYYWSGDDRKTEHLLRGDTNDPSRIDTLFATPRHIHVESVSADDRYVFLSLGSELEGRDLWVHDRTSGETSELLATRFNEEAAVLSRNGSWVAYTSDETGTSEVYLNAFPEMNNRRPLTSGGGSGPIWSVDGNTLYYFSRDLGLTRQSISNGIPGSPETHIEVPGYMASFGTHRDWDIVGEEGLMVFLDPGIAQQVNSGDPLMVFTGMQTLVASLDPEAK